MKALNMIRKMYREMLHKKTFFKRSSTKKVNAPVSNQPSIAFFYGLSIPIGSFSPGTRLVVESEAVVNFSDFKKNGVTPFAYISIGEAEAWRTTTQALPAGWFLGVNESWQSRVADLTNPNWRRFILEDRVEKFWRLGYRGVFLDTLDSHKLTTTDPMQLELQKIALTELIKEIKKRFPKIEILINRGFDLLPEIHTIVIGVVAESLIQSWDPIKKQYTKVIESDHLWLLNQLRHIKNRYHLLVTVIDYVPPDERELARNTARRIESYGFGAWISSPTLDSLNLGTIG